MNFRKQILTGLLSIGTLVACNSIEEKKLAENDLNDQIQKDSTAIMANFNHQEECWNNGDLECYVQAYHPDEMIQTISSVGVVNGMDAILEQYKRFYPKGRMGHLHFDQINLKRLSDEYYYVVGRFNLKYETPDTLFQGWFSVLMKKYQDDWFMISDHSS